MTLGGFSETECGSPIRSCPSLFYNQIYLRILPDSKELTAKENLRVISGEMTSPLRPDPASYTRHFRKSVQRKLWIIGQAD